MDRPRGLIFGCFSVVWVGFGLFTILCGTLVALYADRLAHRRRLAVLTDYFEHVLQLPLAFHGEIHSGRLMKIMLQGTDALWALWLGFFRDNLAAFVSLLILMPLALFINWRLAILLIVLCVLFAVLTALVLRKTEIDAAKRANPALGPRRARLRCAGQYCIGAKFCTRVESEVMALRTASERLLAAQFPVLSWWAVVALLTRAATTLTVLSIILVGTWLFQHGLISIGEIVTFMAFAGMVIGRLDQAVSFVNRMAMDSAKLREFFDVLDTIPAMHDRPDAIEPGRLTGRVEFQERVVFLRRQTAGGLRSGFHGTAGRDGGAGGCDRRRKIDRTCTAASRLRSAIGDYQDRRRRCAGHQACRASTQYRRGVSGGAAVQSLDCGKSAGRQARCHRGPNTRGGGARAGAAILSSSTPMGSTPKWGSAGEACRAANASVCQSRGHS